MRATFLGTGGSIPQAGRNPSGVALEMEGDLLLFDCGEGSQRQMMKYKTGFEADQIYVSHVHGDHVLGLPGLSQTWTFQGREKDVSVFCPEGTSRVIRDCFELAGHRPPYEVRVNEVEPGDVVRADGYDVRAFETRHGAIESVGYAVVEHQRKGEFDRERAESLGVPRHLFSRLHEGEDVELEDGTVVRSEQVVGEPRPGRKFVYTGDTRPSEAVLEASRDACLLVHDGTFGEDHAERAVETNHSTARDAAETAREADVELLALTHVSSRYSASADELEGQAREAHDRSFVAEDGDRVVIEYPDKDRQTRVVDTD
ncbi:MAG: ribonuclease Z [Halobacteriota archaeon]